MIIKIILTIVLLSLLVGVWIGVLKVVSGLLNFYGGLGGTILAYAINTIEWCVIAWLVGLLIPYVDSGLGCILGPLYCTWCWIFNKENKLIAILYGPRH